MCFLEIFQMVKAVIEDQVYDSCDYDTEEEKDIVSYIESVEEEAEDENKEEKEVFSMEKYPSEKDNSTYCSSITTEEEDYFLELNDIIENVTSVRKQLEAEDEERVDALDDGMYQVDTSTMDAILMVKRMLEKEKNLNSPYDMYSQMCE